MKKEDVISTIKEFFNKLGVHILDVKVIEKGDIIVYNVETNDSARAIGRQGEHLEALHHLIGLALKKMHKDDVHFNLDINGFKQSEMNELIAEVRKVVEEVLKTKKEVALRPMTSYERLLIHNMFSDDIRIETSSAGEGKDRHVVIKYSVI